MKCPECGGKLIVIETRNNEKAAETYRQRVCNECGHEIYTTEYEIIKTDDFTRVWNRYSRHNIRRRNK